MMTLTEIKKELYRRKPAATLQVINKDGIHYRCYLNTEVEYLNFLVPFAEIGDSKFYDTADAQLLIRYITNKL